jgi:cathepsin E
MVFASLLTTVLLALAVAADPIPVKKSLVTLPISRRINMMNGVRILEHDQLRAKALMDKGQGEARAVAAGAPLSKHVSSQAENQAISYVASIGVGSPATQCKLYSN